MIFRLFKHLREYKKPTIITLVLMVCEAVIETFIPFMTAELVNTIEAGGNVGKIVKTGLLLFVMAACSLACGGSAGFTSAKASAGFAKNLRGDIFRRVQTFSFENIDKFSSASLVTRMTTDISNVQIAYMMCIRTAIRSPLMLVFSVIMAYRMGGSMAWMFAIVIPVLAGGFLLIARFAMPAFKRVFKKYDRLNESIEENVRAMRVVKGFSREEYEKDKFDFAARDIRKDFTHADRIIAFNSPVMLLCIYFNMIFVLILGSKLIISSGATAFDVGQLSALLTYGMQVLMSLMMLSVIFIMLTISAESIKRICEVLEEEPALKNPENPCFEIADGSIDFNNVTFKYSRSARLAALSEVNLHIPSGATVGIIGGTGASKSTLVQLIPRLYDTTSGSVLVAGKDVKSYDLGALRDSVAMVLQKNLLFSGTIKENLLWGNEGATDEEIYEACRLACAEEFITAFPEKYETKIEQGGTNVSGGQKQRLCIARALLKKPKILILDDSTSAVDTKTDALIREGFKKFIPQTTKIIIAQRISSVMDADMIVVLDGGKISGVGNHTELLENNEIYREVYLQQSKGGDESEE